MITRDNQLVPDGQWEHIELVPLSFQMTVQQLCSKAYISPYGDISVHAIPSEEDTLNAGATAPSRSVFVLIHVISKPPSDVANAMQTLGKPGRIRRLRKVPHNPGCP